MMNNYEHERGKSTQLHQTPGPGFFTLTEDQAKIVQLEEHIKFLIEVFLKRDSDQRREIEDLRRALDN